MACTRHLDTAFILLRGTRRLTLLPVLRRMISPFAAPQHSAASMITMRRCTPLRGSRALLSIVLRAYETPERHILQPLSIHTTYAVCTLSVALNPIPDKVPRRSNIPTRRVPPFPASADAGNVTGAASPETSARTRPVERNARGFSSCARGKRTILPHKKTVSLFPKGDRFFLYLQPPQEAHPECRFRTLGAIARPPSAVSRS